MVPGPHLAVAATSRHRAFRGVAVLFVLALSWIALALLSRGRLADRQQLVTQLFAGLVIATYAGAWLGAIGATRHPRRMLLRALATTSVVLASLAILELAAAFRWVHWMLIFRALSGEGVDYRTAYVLDEALSFRRIPGLQWSGRPASDIEATYGLPATVTRPITFNYDQWGYRNAVTMATADIVLLGDSYVEGWYVSDDETVAARLTERLNRPVANLAVAGYGTLQELQVLKTDALRRHPKVVAWFFFEGNDLYDDQKFENTLLAGPPSRDDTTPTRAGLTRTHGWVERSFVLNAFKWIRRSAHPLVPNQVPYWARLKGASTEARLYFFGYGGVPWTKFEEDRWAIARAAFEEGVAFSSGHGIHLVLVYVPTKYRVFRDFIDIPPASPMAGWTAWHQLPAHFQELCRAAGVPCLDLTERLQASIRAGHLPYALNDTHWSPDGHAIVAAALEDALRERAW